MNKPNINKKVFLAFFALFFIGVVAGAGVAVALTPTQTMGLYGGNYPGAPLYTVWEDDSNYFAKNQLGIIVYSSGNFSDVAQDAIDSAYSLGGGTVKISGSITGLTNKITVKPYVWLEGDGNFGENVRITTTADITMIELKEHSGLRNLNLRVDCATYTRAALLISDEVDQIQKWDITVEDVFIMHDVGDPIGGTGFELRSNYIGGITENQFDNLFIWGFFNYGILLNSTDPGWINSNTFDNPRVYGCPYGIYMVRQGSGYGLNGNVFTNGLYQDHSGNTVVAVTVKGMDNHFDNWHIWDVGASDYGLNMSGSLLTRMFNTYISGQIASLGSLATMRGTSVINSGTTKYFDFQGSATISAGSNNVIVTHNLWTNPLSIKVTGSTTFSHTLYVDSVNANTFRIVSNQTVPVDTTIYYTVSDTNW